MAYEDLDAATCRKIASDMVKAPAGAVIELPPKAVAALYATLAVLLDAYEQLEERIQSLEPDEDDPDDGERAPKLKVVG